MASNSPARKKFKRSFVHAHFFASHKDDKIEYKCKKCIYTCIPKGGCTSSLIYHLRTSHNITNTEGEDDSDSPMTPNGPNLKKQPSVDSYWATPSRSDDEWLAYQVVVTGMSLRQLAYCQFQKHARTHLRLKVYKSHVTIGEHVNAHIKKMKENTIVKLKQMYSSGERFSVMADEWTSSTNKRFMNVCLKTNKETFNLGLVRCKGSLTSKVTVELLKVSISFCNDFSNDYKGKGKKVFF